MLQALDDDAYDAVLTLVRRLNNAERERVAAELPVGWLAPAVERALRGEPGVRVVRVVGMDDDLVVTCVYLTVGGLYREVTREVHVDHDRGLPTTAHVWLTDDARDVLSVDLHPPVKPAPRWAAVIRDGRIGFACE